MARRFRFQRSGFRLSLLTDDRSLITGISLKPKVLTWRQNRVGCLRLDFLVVLAAPSIVVVNTGTGKAVTSTTLRKDVYAYIFNQQGFMAGAGIQRSKITKVK
jgi:hypothetical protein